MLNSYDISVLYKIYKERVNDFKLYHFLSFINEKHSHLKNKLKIDLIINYKDQSYENILNNFFSSYEKYDFESFVSFLKEIDSDFSKVFQDIEFSLFKEKQEETNMSNTFINEVGLKLPFNDDIYIGRNQEIEYFDILLSRKYKNNVVIIGDPGIGKTAFVNHYSLMSEKDIWYIDISRILSGTKYRGEFEQKMIRVIDEAINASTILFIDEIHILLGAGVTEGGVSASNILKPYLTNPNLQVIGATTTDEFKTFMHDRALERRFNVLFLSPLEKKDMYDIVNKISQIFNFTNEDSEIIDHVYDQLDNYMSYRSFPDKLIDFFDFYYTFLTKKNMFPSLLSIDKGLSLFLSNGGNYEKNEK